MKDINKPIDVNSNISPITKQPIQEIRADKWLKMSTSDLFDQKLILESRLAIANRIGNFSLMQQIQMGIDQIHAIINSRNTNSDDVKLL